MKFTSGYAYHRYVVVTTPGACVENGKETRTCTVCDKVVVITKSKGDHPLERTALAEPTCTSTGSYKDVCRICGTVVEEGMLKANGHHDRNDDEFCDICGAPMESESAATGVCDKCGKDHGDKVGGLFGYNGFICKLLAFFRSLTKLFSK